MSDRRIFVVEDEALIAMEIQDHLRTLGYMIAGHAARGVVALREIPRARPDLVLMDVNLGRGPSGIEVALQLREEIDVPVVFLTAYSDVELAERATQTESFAYIVKPFQPQALRANIEMALYKHAAERRLQDANRRLDEGAAALRVQADQLQRSLSLLQATLDATADGILVIAEGELRGTNKQLLEIWGLAEAPRSLDELAVRVRRPEELLRDLPAGVESDLVELRDGRILARRVRTQLVDGVAVGRVCSFRDVTRERQAEAKLRESEDRFRRVVENISDGLVVDDLGGQILFANDRFCEIFAVDRRALAGKTIEDFAAAGWRSALREQRLDQLERDVSSRSIYQAQRLDGTPLWVEADVVVLHDASGAMIGTQRTLRDITDRRETEEALRILSTGVAHLSGEALLDELVRHLTRLLEADVGVVGALSKSDARSSRTIGLWVDGAAESTVGFALHELPPIGTEGPLVVAEGAQERFPGSPALAHFAAQGCALAPLIDSQGRRIGVIGVLSRAPLRRPSRIAGLLGLFAVLASANLERHREETKLHDLFEYSPDAVLMVNEAGGIVMANIRAQELLGYSREELLQANIDAMVPGESRAFHAILRRRFLSQPRARPMGSLKEPLRALRKDGATVPVDISLGPIRADEEILIVVSIRDMTQHVLAEERRASLELRLRHAQKLEALGTLAGGIAHDFNNILGALVANTELARTEIDRGHVVAGRLEEIAAAADRATLLVRQILAFSRRQPPRRAITTLAPVVDEAARLLRATLPARIQLKVEIGEAVPNVLADATQLHQVIMNLGTNAWHAIDDAGGTVTIRLDAHEGSGRAPSRRFARISVSDTGSGMDAALLDRIFEPFFTTKPVGEGSGLGLSVVHGIVTEHGGELTIDTALGRGTTITILLPAVEGEAIRPASDEPVQGGGDWRVLMIDDDPILATVGEALLVRLGYQVRAFTDPVAAIVAFRGAPEDYDVVITDFNMPTMSGVDVAREVAAMRSEVPIVLVSGHSEHTDEELALAGVRFRLDKPYNLKSLDRILSRVRSELGGGTRK